MGNERSSMRDYNIGQPFPANKEHPQKVSIFPATHKINDCQFTIFQYKKEHGKDESAAKNVEILCTMRHPHILKYVACFDTSSSKTLVTEHAIPLDVAVESQELEEIYVGLYNIMEALEFLHDKGFVCHNDITVSSIFVTADGIWKVGCFDKATKVLRLSKQSYVEDLKGFAEFALSVLEYLQDNSDSTKSFMKVLECDVLAEGLASPLVTLTSLMQDSVFKFRFHEVLQDLQNLTLKTSEEKHLFFCNLGDRLIHFSPQLLSRRIIPTLFSTMILTDPSAEPLLVYLFASGNDYCQEHEYQSLLKEEFFKKCSLPMILELFQCRDVAVRLILLKYLPLYVDMINRIILTEDIMPEILLGLKDENEEIVIETFKSLAFIVPLLGANVVVGQTREKIFFDRKPDFSRSPKAGSVNNKKKQNVSSVTDVMKNLSYEQDSEKRNKERIKPDKDANKLLLERQKKRLEREKQREEQRLRREERRKQREEEKVKKIITTSSFTESEPETCLPAVLETNRSYIPVEGTFENEFTNEDMPVIQTETSATLVAKDEEIKHNNSSSDQEWEGFEAFSNSSDSEPAKDTKNEQASAISVVRHKPIENFNDGTFNNKEIGSDDENIEGWGWEENTPVYESKPLVNILTDDSKKDEIKENTAIYKDNRLKDKVVKPTLMSSKKLVLSNHKQNSSSIDKNKNKKSQKELGNEFDIVIDSLAVKEPDYFADMLPSYEKPTEIIDQKPLISSKFEALSPTDVSGDGWGDDTEDWNDF